MTPQEKYFKENELHALIIERDELNSKIVDLEMSIKIGELENEITVNQ